MLRLAIATCLKYPNLLAPYDDLTPLLAAEGIEAHLLPWDDPAVDWSGFDAAVLIGAWGYHRRMAEFLDWLGRLEDCGTVVLNSPDLIRWNSRKTYLRELAERGIRVVPTVFVEPGEQIRLHDILTDRNWPQAVLKPAISAGADDTARISLAEADAHQPNLATILTYGPAMIQPFMPEVSAGEWSLYYFAGELSHTVVKRPVAGDYRVQHDFGGTVEALDPPTWLRDQAEAALAALPESPLYARIDGLCRDRDFYLMEAELIEPYLYLEYSEPAPKRFVGALAGRLR
ncbi:hypothetical protein D5S18_07475 [Nocardia panacis]|uniref:Glutathione synthetase n=1 Tax=Nocardia panacis TaxID=2340916 RepID=A0A3A4KBV6_9NOCA|nr:hypothetical protein [Nocardia panacis]RJO77578.1 hypothetical protein D5S18_07475 [Nocardia panacis]